MKIRYIAIILGIVITGSVIFGVTFKMPLDGSTQISFESPIRDEYYEIQITGMKDVYLVGEQYDFSYVISGYGNSCGRKTVSFPDQNGDTTTIATSASCIAGVSMKDFVFDVQKERGTTYGHVKLQNPGWYVVWVEFERSNNFEPTQNGHQFFVAEKICDDLNPEKRAQCFVTSYKSCESAYMAQQFTSEDGGDVSLVATVESRDDCKLTVYTENSLGEHSQFNGIRSICEYVTVSNDSLNFEGCNNADYPPIMFTVPNSELDPKTLECYSLFDCNSAEENFEECVNSYKYGFTVKSMCQFSNVTVNGGCVNIVFSNDSGVVSCDE